MSDYQRLEPAATATWHGPFIRPGGRHAGGRNGLGSSHVYVKFARALSLLEAELPKEAPVYDPEAAFDAYPNEDDTYYALPRPNNYRHMMLYRDFEDPQYEANQLPNLELLPEEPLLWDEAEESGDIAPVRETIRRGYFDWEPDPVLPPSSTPDRCMAPRDFAAAHGMDCEKLRRLILEGRVRTVKTECGTMIALRRQPVLLDAEGSVVEKPKYAEPQPLKPRKKQTRKTNRRKNEHWRNPDTAYGSMNDYEREARAKSRKIREWARANGYKVGRRGAVPAEIIAAYERSTNIDNLRQALAQTTNRGA